MPTQAEIDSKRDSLPISHYVAIMTRRPDLLDVLKDCPPEGSKRALAGTKLTTLIDQKLPSNEQLERLHILQNLLETGLIERQPRCTDQWAIRRTPAAELLLQKMANSGSYGTKWDRRAHCFVPLKSYDVARQP